MKNNENILLKVENLVKSFPTGGGKSNKVLDGISFSIAKGNTLGLVGESGCGKTTVGRTVLRLYGADAGKVLFNGQDVHRSSRKQYKQLTKQMQMIFQDPYASLNPRMTVGEIIGEGMDIHKLYKGDKRTARITELLELVGLNREHASRFPHEFSGGQRQRIGIARALAVEPQFIVCDEAISALDVSIQAQVINLLMDLQDKLGLTYLFISHDLSMVKHISDEIAVMYLGNMVERAETEELYKHPLHPYTKGLLSAIPTPDPIYEKQREHVLIRGDIMTAAMGDTGCKFRSRCSIASELCSSKPLLREVKQGHFVACHHVD